MKDSNLHGDEKPSGVRGVFITDEEHKTILRLRRREVIKGSSNDKWWKNHQLVDNVRILYVIFTRISIITVLILVYNSYAGKVNQVEADDIVINNMLLNKIVASEEEKVVVKSTQNTQNNSVSGTKIKELPPDFKVVDENTRKAVIEEINKREEAIEAKVEAINSINSSDIVEVLPVESVVEKTPEVSVTKAK